MRTLYFIRHGLADRSAYDGADDNLRPLTEAGRERLLQTTEMLNQMGWEPDQILTSPLTRARQTAELIAEEIGLQDKVAVVDELACGFGPEDLDGILSRFPEATKLALVGHEPDFSWTISRLTGGSKIVCKKGSLARVDLYHENPATGQLVWLVPPKVLVQTAQG